MKRILVSLGVIMVAVLSLTNCTKENQIPVQNPESENSSFVIYANSADTKTINEGKKTKWSDGDALSVYFVWAEGTYYANLNHKFTLENAEENKFVLDGTFQRDLYDRNDWYAFYPYTDAAWIAAQDGLNGSKCTIGSSDAGSQIQTGNNNMTHIAGPNYPMWGFAFNVAKGDPVNIAMTHLSSLVEVHVINTSDKPLIVKEISLSAPENIVGKYKIQCLTVGDPINYDPVYNPDSQVSDVATLVVKNGEEIAAGDDAYFYLAIKPFTAKTGQTLTLTVNDCVKPLELTSDVTFSPGKIKPLKFSYVAAAPVEITIDGNFDDWNKVNKEVVCPPGKSNDLLQKLKCYVDGENVNLYFELLNSKFNMSTAANTYICIDNDCDAATGATYWPFGNSGFTYFMEGSIADGNFTLGCNEWKGEDGGDIFGGATWVGTAQLTGKLVVGEVLDRYECSIKRSIFPTLNSTIGIGVYIISKDANAVSTHGILPANNTFLDVTVPVTE